MALKLNLYQQEYVKPLKTNGAFISVNVLTKETTKSTAQVKKMT